MHNKKKCLIVHIIHRLAVGGLENGLVNIVNKMSTENFRHAIVCLADYTDFRDRIANKDVEVFALHKKPGKDFLLYVRLWSLLRKLKPDIVHTRNMGTMEMLVPAMMAGVRCRVHGEHGRDTSDLDGSNKKYIFLRKLIKPFVHEFIALSKDIERWLIEVIEVDEGHLTQIYNGVDTSKFRLANLGSAGLPIDGFANKENIVISTVGRMQGEKDQLTLVKAFLLLVKRDVKYYEKLRLVLIGDGPLRQTSLSLLKAEKVSDIVWLPGARNDTDEILRATNIFVLPSLTEGVSNTILEAMATGLPVVATNVGGNPELVDDGVTGTLVPASNPKIMADAIQRYVDDPALRLAHGAAGIKRINLLFSMDKMVSAYEDVYRKASNKALGIH